MDTSKTRPDIQQDVRAFLLPALCTTLSIATVLSPGSAAAQTYVGPHYKQEMPARAPEPQRNPEPERQPISTLSASELLELEALLTAEAQKVVNRQERIPGQGRIITVRVHYERETDLVVVDLGPAYIPRGMEFMGDDIREAIMAVSNAVYDLLADSFEYEMTDVRFNGKDLGDFFEEFKNPAKGNEKHLQNKTDSEPSPVVISPGHGWYYHHGFPPAGLGWKLQRPTESNGIIEDFITPEFAIELGSWLSLRNEGTISFISSTRPLFDTSTYVESGKPWNEMAARYYIKSLLPDRPDIWNQFPNGKSGRRELREYDEDIAARPSFADYLSAGSLLSLHTNAADNLQARGTQVYVFSKSLSSRELGNRILCSMKELIQAQPGYENWKVENSVRFGNYGENAAQAPAVIIEMGFHTNADDAAALLDSEFQRASMKGIEKGYRMFKQGNPCQHFGITQLDDPTGPQNTDVPVEVHFEGHPQFPVTANIEFLTCASGWTCNSFTRTFASKQASPLIYQHRCNTTGSTPTTTFRVKATLTDADGVTTSKEYNWTCTA